MVLEIPATANEAMNSSKEASYQESSCYVVKGGGITHLLVTHDFEAEIQVLFVLATNFLPTF